MPIDWPKLTHRIDTLIRSGKSALVVEEFERLKRERVPREHLVSMANLSFRAELPAFGLRILNPIVRNQKQGTGTASAQEQAEYAYGLVRIGAAKEALEILAKIDKAIYPRAGYYEGCAHVSFWGYAEAIPLFEKYIETLSPDDYLRTVAEMNLAAAYVHERESEKAEPLLAHLLEVAEAKKLVFAQGQALHLRAENLINQKAWEEAASALEDATRFFRNSAGLDGFFVKKLVHQMKLELNPSDPSPLSALKAYQQEAIKNRQWETVRDCDRIIALNTKDQDLFSKIYFGTPYDSFRKRLLSEYQEKTPIPKSWDWVLAEKNKKAPVLDLLQGKFGRGKESFERGSLLHRLLLALSSDFYRPIRLAPLHQALYPGEFFNIRSSSYRVHRALTRLRSWADENDMPIRVAEEDEFYSLSATEPLVVRVPSPDFDLVKTPEPLERLMEHFGEKSFAVSEARAVLGTPIRTLSRLLNKCVEEGVLLKTGVGSTTRYHFPKRAIAA